MIQTPTHDEALALWSTVCKQAGNEFVVLILPNAEGLCATAFQPTEERPLEDCMEDSIHALLDNDTITEECPWGALVAPSFVSTMKPTEVPSHGDLQARYVAGDEAVREIVVVIIMEMDEPPMGRSYSQPLLEPLDKPDVMMPGPMTLSLMSVLMHAAFPADFKDA